MSSYAQAIHEFRNFILSSIRSEFRSRFMRSKLGGLWMIIHPLAQVLIFALILSEVLSAKLPNVQGKYAYSLYLLAGMLFWTLFAETIVRCLGMFIDNATLLKKVSFPRICLPVIGAGVLLINNALLAAAIFLVFAGLQHFVGPQALWLPVLILMTISLAMSIGLVLGILNVFARDIGQVVPVVLSALFWLTPIVYSVDALPAHIRHWFKHNPLYPLAVSYQNVLVYDQAPLWESLAEIAVFTLLASVAALYIFRRANADVVDAL